jgi:hypothetical protein
MTIFTPLSQRIVDRIEATDVNSLTPLQALNLLEELQQEQRMRQLLSTWKEARLIGYAMCLRQFRQSRQCHWPCGQRAALLLRASMES